MRFASCLPLFGIAALAALAGGCPATVDPGTPSSCNDYSPPAGFDGLTPPTSLSKDVLPVFKQSCAFSTCHGSTTGSSNGVFLGSDAAKVHTSIVNVKGDEMPTMAFVTPGDPRSSYLMRKMDGSQCALDKECSGGSCQSSMPKGDLPLPVDRRDIVRRWIAQGAKND